MCSGVQDTESRDRDRNTFCNRRSHARSKHKHANKREDGPPDHRLSKLRRSAICLRAQRILGYKGHKISNVTFHLKTYLIWKFDLFFLHLAQDLGEMKYVMCLKPQGAN